jgi:hypothetical protein
MRVRLSVFANSMSARAEHAREWRRGRDVFPRAHVSARSRSPGSASEAHSLGKLPKELAVFDEARSASAWVKATSCRFSPSLSWPRRNAIDSSSLTATSGSRTSSAASSRNAAASTTARIRISFTGRSVRPKAFATPRTCDVSRHRRFHDVLVPTVIGIVCFIVAALCVGPAWAIPAGGVGSSVSAFGGCSAASPVARPTYILVGCGDGGVAYRVGRWSSWTSAGARGSATEFVNLCEPSCAAGHFLTHRVSLRLWRPRLCSNHRLEFTRLTARRFSTTYVRTLRSPWGGVDRVTCPWLAAFPARERPVDRHR